MFPCTLHMEYKQQSNLHMSLADQVSNCERKCASLKVRRPFATSKSQHLKSGSDNWGEYGPH